MVNLEVTTAGGFIIRNGLIILGELSPDQAAQLSAMALAIHHKVIQVNAPQPLNVDGHDAAPQS